MSSNNPIQETESTEKPESPLLEDSDQESTKKSKAEQDSGDEKEEGSASPPKSNGTEEEEGGRERLKRHRVEVAGRVWIPDMWGQEDLLKDWIDCTAFDASLARATILMARDSLAKDARTPPHSTHLRLHHG